MHPCHRMSKAVVLMLCSAAPSLALVHTPVLRTAAVRNVQVPHAMWPSLINTQPHTASIARTSHAACALLPVVSFPAWCKLPSGVRSTPGTMGRGATLLWQERLMRTL